MYACVCVRVCGKMCHVNGLVCVRVSEHLQVSDVTLVEAWFGPMVTATSNEAAAIEKQ